MRKEVLVTGATGFVGPHVVEALLEAGYRVRVAGLEAIPATDQVIWRKTNFLEQIDYPALVAGVNVVIHLAAELRDPDKMDQVNVKATGALAKAAEKEGVTLFIYTSSVGVYGHPPIANVNEETPTLSIDNERSNVFLSARFLYDYCITKLRGEHLIRQYLHNTQAIILRPSNIVSEDEIRKVLEYKMPKRIWRGYRRTHHIYVKDVAAAIIFFLRQHFADQVVTLSNPEIYNLSNDTDPKKSYANLFKMYAKATGDWRNGCPFTLPAILDFVKDRVKFRTMSRALPAGAVDYTPAKLLEAGFAYRHGIDSVYQRVFQEILSK